MTPKFINRIVTVLLIAGILILVADSYLKAKDVVKAHTQYNEQVYAEGNFQYQKTKDPQDKDSKALYWYLQTLQ